MGDIDVQPLDLVFDSRNSTNPDRPEFYIKDLYDVIGCSVMWVNMPMSFFVIDELNNKIQWKWRSAPVGSGLDAAYVNVWQTLTLKNGTYSPVGFQQEFRRALFSTPTLTGTGEQRSNTLSKIFCLIDSSDSRLTIYHQIVTNPTFSVKIDNAELAAILGFEVGAEYQSGNDFVWSQGSPVDNDGVDYVKGPNMVKLIGQPRIDLHSTLCDSATLINGEPSSDVILSFPITGKVGDYVTFQANPAMIPLSRPPMSAISFYLTQGDRKEYKTTGMTSSVNYLPLNGDGFQVCVRFYKDNGVLKV